MAQDERKNPYLMEEIAKIIVETDEENPTTIAEIDEVLKPAEGYRVRVQFQD